jgi:hypothetical protein
MLAGIMVVAMSTTAMAQLSPGPLSRAHKDLDALLKCLDCHGGEQSMADRCMDCHKAIAFLAIKGRGLHGRLPDQECSGCHVEHAGRDFALISFEEGSPEKFNHRRAGWPLDGRHADRRCEDCHKPEFQKSKTLEMSDRKDPENSYLGLDTSCVSCHADVHRRSLGLRCGECHTPVSWKELPNFDHALTGYPLTGKHTELKCEKCHNNADRQAVAAPKPLPYGQCSSCHKDTHEGRLGPACSDCHVTTGFRDRGKRSIDHAHTGYPLAGKHLDVKCQGCHEKEMRPAYGRCLDCHTDQHADQLAGRADGGECAACHLVEGWKPSTFTVQDHDRIQFPLEGRHKVIDCALCHYPEQPRSGNTIAITPPGNKLGQAKVALRLGRPECTACHIDPHDGRLAAAFRNTDQPACTTCHGHEGFRPSTLTAQTHGTLGFPLEGAHASAPCLRCHEGIGGRPPESNMETAECTQAMPVVAPDQSPDEALLFRADPRCISCHFNPHGGQFLSRRDGGNCGSCHDDNSFRPALKFDHNRTTRFPLLRAHGNVPCGICHERNRGDSGLATVTYRPVSLDCRECHRRTAGAVNGRAGRFPNPQVLVDEPSRSPQ